MGYIKQVIVCRRDLSMPTGKFGAMVAHAGRSFLINRLHKNGYTSVLCDDGSASGWCHFEFMVSPIEEQWLSELDPGLEEQKQVSMATIVLAVNSEEELLEVEKNAREAKLEVHRVIDSGFSHNKPGTFVCIGIGPDKPERIDPVTGKLKVYR